MAAQTTKSVIGLVGLAVMGQVSRLPGQPPPPPAGPPPPGWLPAMAGGTHSAAPSAPATHLLAAPQNLALNVAEKGFPISVYNRSSDKTDAAVARAGKEGVGALLHGYKDLKDFVMSLERPR